MPLIAMQNINDDEIQDFFVDENGIKQGESCIYAFSDKTRPSRQLLREQFSYLDGKIHGEHIVYHGNTHIHTVSQYVHGKMHGKYMNYSYGGHLRRIAWYDNGAHSGEEVCFNADGQVIVRRMMQDGNYHGQTIRYDTTILIPRDIAFYANSVEITNDISEVVNDMHHISNEEKMMIKLRWGIKCLDYRSALLPTEEEQFRNFRNITRGLACQKT